MKRLVLSLAAACMAFAFGVPAAQAGQGDTLAKVKERGRVLCPGHNGSYLGFAEVDDAGNWKGLDIELCKALSTAIFGSPDKAEIVPLSWAQRFPALAANDIDAIIKVTAWTLGRDTEIGLQFSRPYLIGTTQLLVTKALGAETAADLDGGSICVGAGSATERQVTDYFKKLGVEVNLITYENTNEMVASYFAGRCDALSGWGPNIAIRRASAPNPDDHVFLPDVVALEAEAIAVRQGDDQWVDIMNWLLSALMTAEQFGITQANVDDAKANPASPEVERLLGVTPGVGDRLGLSNDWAYNVIKTVGNYGEIFDRTLGADSPYKMPRGANALWTDGGVMFPLAFD